MDVNMTHDELLEKIKSFTCCSGVAEVALLAVVELHNPYIMQNGDKEYIGCSCIPELPAFLNPYPCPTIQAIEEKLI